MAKAYTEFMATLDRSDDLIALYRTNPALNEPEDLLRMAVVLGVSAMDSYFTTKFCDILVPHLKKRGATPKIVTFLGDAGLDAKMALELITMDRPYRRIRTLVERSFDTFTTQRTDVIDNLFLSVGLKDLCDNAQRRAGRTNLLTRVRNLIDRRHSIVHESDLKTNSRTKALNCNQVERQLNDLRLFVEHIDFIIESAAKKRETRKKAAKKK